MERRLVFGLSLTLMIGAALGPVMAQERLSSSRNIAAESANTIRLADASTTRTAESRSADQRTDEHRTSTGDYWPLLFVLALSTFIGMGVIGRVSRLLHTPLMSLTNAISAIAVVGAIIVTGGDYPLSIRILGSIALFASMTNIVSGFLITDRMLKMFKKPREEVKP
jgi:proton-translocating NAD(P)+ transhydrogenase subunit alpha